MTPECLYDAYVALTEETISFFSEPELQRKLAIAQDIDSLREVLQLEPGYLYQQREVPPGLRYLQQQLRQINPYILTQPIVQMGLDMAEKAGSVPVPYEPFLKLPFWVEFEGMAVGDDTTQFVAILAMRDFHQEDTTHVQLMTPDLQRTKELYFKDAAWEYEQIGACESTTCALARYTREQEPYRITQSDAPSWIPQGCTCAQGGFTWAQILNIINHILRHRKEPVVQSITQREVALPYQHPKTRKEKVANSEASRRSSPNIVTVSLSAPVRVHQRSKSESAGRQEGGLETEKITVEGYWKVLIPGEGKPWKSLQIVPVESYERTGEHSISGANCCVS